MVSARLCVAHSRHAEIRTLRVHRTHTRSTTQRSVRIRGPTRSATQSQHLQPARRPHDESIATCNFSGLRRRVLGWHDADARLYDLSIFTHATRTAPAAA